jgi:hypothetical protein
VPFTIKSCHWITFVGEASQFSRAKTRSKPRRGPDPVVRSPKSKVQSPKRKARGEANPTSTVHLAGHLPRISAVGPKSSSVRFSRKPVRKDGWVSQPFATNGTNGKAIKRKVSSFGSEGGEPRVRKNILPGLRWLPSPGAWPKACWTSRPIGDLIFSSWPVSAHCELRFPLRATCALLLLPSVT